MTTDTRRALAELREQRERLAALRARLAVTDARIRRIGTRRPGRVLAS